MVLSPKPVCYSSVSKTSLLQAENQLTEKSDLTIKGGGLTCEQIAIVLLQLDRLLIEFTRTLSGVFGPLSSQLFDGALILCLQEDDHWCVLAVVESVYSVRSYVQDAMLTLGKTVKTQNIV